MSLIPKNLALTVIIHYLHNQTLYQDNTVLKFCGTGGKTRAQYENEYRETHP